VEPYDVVLYPLMTEVASRMLETENKLVLMVNLKATKEDIQQAVEALYEVRVKKVARQRKI